MEAQNSAIINKFYYVGEKKEKRNHCLQISIYKMAAAHNDDVTCNHYITQPLVELMHRLSVHVILWIETN